MPKKYDQQLREHAVRMVLDKRAVEGCSQRVAMDAVGASLGIAPATIGNWMPRPGEQSAAVAGTEHGVAPSVGTVGDSYDNALAEAVNGLYKAELIYSRTTWPATSAVELAKLEWVSWWNHQRLHEALDYQTPVEVEAAYDQAQTRALVTT